MVIYRHILIDLQIVEYKKAGYFRPRVTSFRKWCKMRPKLLVVFTLYIFVIEISIRR